MYSFKAGELAQMLTNAGFNNITVYSDFKQCVNDRADFYTYLAFKPRGTPKSGHTGSPENRP